jgi:molybdopterin/thiamine biosynthesis adenylyltransferase
MNVIFKCTKKFVDNVRRDLARPHKHAWERVGFISVRAAATPANLVLIAESYYPVADDDYLVDPTVGAMMNSEAIRKALEIAMLQKVGMFHVHLHDHHGQPGFSHTDVREQRKFIPDFFKICPKQPHGAIVLSHDLAEGQVWISPDKILAVTEFNFIGAPTTIHIINQKLPPPSISSDFTRQSFLGAHSEQMFANIRALVIGAGGGGSHVCQQLAHIGVGHIRIVDPQEIEASNLNRLIGGTTKDVEEKTPKVKIAERVIRSIRPWAEVSGVQSEWQRSIDLLPDAHVVFGNVDSYQQRMYLERACRRYCVPYIDIGMDVTELSHQMFAIAGQMITSLPGSYCMRCIGFLTQERVNQEENEYGAAGGVPQVVWTNGTLASLAVGSFVRLFTPWFRYSSDYEWLELDGNNQTVSRSRQPQYNVKGPCEHFSQSDVGDPFFDLALWQQKVFR